MAVLTSPNARQKLDASKLKAPMMGEDVDISGLITWYKGIAGVDLEAATTDIQLNPTMEGASTVTVSLTDQDRLLLRSGKLASRQDIEIDGMWFRLAQVSKGGKNLTLIFEDREVAILRTYDKPIKQSGATSRTRVTRAQFVLKMLKEVTEEVIPYFIPELNAVEPLDTAASPLTQNDPLTMAVSKGQGIPVHNTLTVKGAPMSDEQRRNANTILNVGTSRQLARKILVVSIMTAIQESSIINLGQPFPGAFNYLSIDPDFNPVGVFQQIKHWGWPASGDVATDAGAFFDKAVPYTVSGLQYFEIAEKVQNSGNGKLYAQWRVEADRIVTEYGNPTTTTQDLNSQWNEINNTGDYEFYRGLPPTTTSRKQKYGSKWGPESTWDCANRLAAEVNWRAFFAIGPKNKNTFYFIDEIDLFKSQPIATLDEDSDGVESIDGDYDEGKKTAQLTVTVRMGRWAAPPGSVIVIRNMGPWNGRWLVNDVKRSAYNSQGTIILKKPMPKLPEPSSGNVLSGQTQLPTTWTGDPAPGQGLYKNQYVNPLVNASGIKLGRTDQGVDFGADALASIVAIGDALIITAETGNPGWPGGGIVVYKILSGDHKGAYVYTAEWITPVVKAGQQVSAGDPIARFNTVQPVVNSGTEMGYCTAFGVPITPYPAGVAHEYATEGGKRFARLLRNLGQTTLDDPGPGSDTYL